MWAILIRVLRIYEVGPGKTPLILLSYQGLRREDKKLGHDWMLSQYNSTRAFLTGPSPFGNIFASDVAGKLLIKLLDLNSQHIPESFKFQRKRFERGFKPSFLLPLDYLTRPEIGSLVTDTGCIVCDKETTSRCSGCHFVRYCSGACQKSDWKTHKSLCASIKQGVFPTTHVTDRDTGVS
ncbi:MYND-type zinc finger protein samB [Abortiporus biennis]